MQYRIDFINRRNMLKNAKKLLAEIKGSSLKKWGWITKVLIGFALIVCGIFFGLYVGGYVCLVGGISDLIDVAKSDVTNSFDILKGAAKIFFAGFLGWLSALSLIIPGAVLMED